MNPWTGKAVFVVGMVFCVAIRVPHDKRSKGVKIAESRKGALEKLLLALMAITGGIFPLMFIVSPLLSFADYPLRALQFWSGVGCLGISLWLFHRAHADLGTNWSNSLELRENHQLVTSGIYGSVRHPMYSAIFVYALAQALLLANWAAGPGCLVVFTLMFGSRLHAEERMMFEKFGQQYEDYVARTKRLIPGIW
jgi:protein-S-isoprenylcysteine O-methyltransferase Ste14